MTLQDLGNVGEFVGALATVATLIYLSIQIRQNTASVQTQAELSLSERMSEWAKEVISNPKMALLWNKAAREPGSLDEEERMLFIWFVFQLFLIVEGHYQLYIKSRISERAFSAKAETALGLMQNPVIHAWWEERIAPFNPDFFDHMDNAFKSGNVTWKYRDINELVESRT